ncbi:MAG: aminopeptidase P family protein [Myxococcota bacterium]
MPDAELFRTRRRALAERVSGPVLLMGNGHRLRNLPIVKLPFRQDSTFLYFTGCAEPGAAALLVDGRCELFLPAPAADDPLWHGERPSPAARGEALGVDRVWPASELEARAAPLRPRTLAVPDESRNALASRICGGPLAFAVRGADGDDALIDAVIALRRVKDPYELAELRAAAQVTARAFRAAMKATRPGSHERGLWALFEAVLQIHGCTPGYATILTQAGEILHAEDHDAPLEAGRLVLLDGGGERPSGYGVDITRTWPVSGRYDPRQRAVYQAVWEAQRAAIAACTVGTRYRVVHDAAATVLATFLRDEGLVKGSVASVVEQGAHAVFFPHGVGHLLGLDVHDLEGFGDRAAYPAGASRSDQFGTAYLRLDLPLEAGWVVTVEPGLYVVPAILADATLRERFGGVVDFARAESWIGFGGIRIEDDVAVGDSGPEVLTRAVPSAIDEVEAWIGTGPTALDALTVDAEALLWEP